MQAKITLEDGRVIDITLTPEQEKSLEVKKVGRWKPKNSERYYLDNGVKVETAEWDNDSIDKGLYETGEVYKTEEQAQFARDRKVFITKVNDRIDELNDGWIPDWNNATENKYFIYSYSGTSNPYTIQYSCVCQVNNGNILHCIKNQDITEQVISEFKDDLMKYIFN